MEDTDEQAQAKLPDTVRATFGRAALIGSPATIRELIAEFEGAGVQELILRFPEVTQPDVIRRFAQEFIA